MNVIHWLKSRFSQRGKALALYRRGMDLAKQRDQQGAIEQYTAAIELEDAPADVKAMAVFNRGLAYLAANAPHKGVADLEAVLSSESTPPQIKSMAKQKLAKRKTRLKDKT